MKLYLLNFEVEMNIIIYFMMKMIYEFKFFINVFILHGYISENENNTWVIQIIENDKYAVCGFCFVYIY